MKRCPINDRTFKECIDGNLSLSLKEEIKIHLEEECDYCSEFFTVNGFEKRIILESILKAEEEKNANIYAYNDFKKDAILNKILSHERKSHIEKIWEVGGVIFKKPAYAGAFIACTVSILFYFAFQHKLLDRENINMHYSGIKGEPSSIISLTAKYGIQNEKKKIEGEVLNNMTLTSSNDIIFNFHITAQTGYIYLFLASLNSRKLIYPADQKFPAVVKRGDNSLLINGRIAAYELKSIWDDLPIIENQEKIRARFCALLTLNQLKDDELSKFLDPSHTFNGEAVSCLNINVIK